MSRFWGDRCNLVGDHWYDMVVTTCPPDGGLDLTLRRLHRPAQHAPRMKTVAYVLEPEPGRVLGTAGPMTQELLAEASNLGVWTRQIEGANLRLWRYVHGDGGCFGPDCPACRTRP